MAYANKTVVSAEKSKVELERMLLRYGATKFVSGWDATRATIIFEMNGRRLRFELPLPDPKEPRFWHTPQGRWRLPSKSSDTAARKAWEQDCRSRWRALVLIVKAKLEAVASGIVTFDNEFLAHLCFGDGSTTVAQWIAPRLEGNEMLRLPMKGG